jgi:hypothetical protein
MSRDNKKAVLKEPLYIVLDDFDLSFYPDEIEHAKSLWVNGTHIKDMSVAMHREVEEVFALLLDLAKHDKIPARKGGG